MRNSIQRLNHRQPQSEGPEDGGAPESKSARDAQLDRDLRTYREKIARLEIASAKMAGQIKDVSEEIDTLRAEKEEIRETAQRLAVANLELVAKVSHLAGAVEALGRVFTGSVEPDLVGSVPSAR